MSCLRVCFLGGRFVIGNAVQATALAGVFGMVMTIGNERQFGTLSSLLATPSNRLALYFGRTLPAITNGLLVSTFCLAASLLLGFRLPVRAVPAMALVLLVAAASCAMFGLTLGAVALRANDIWLSSNLAYGLLILLCGVNVPLADLPGWLAAVGRALPLTHGISAARRVADGASVADVAGLVGREALVGAAYAALGYGLLRLFEVEGRRRATLDTL
jgi:ABC-2 type transport system permease protein